jgi:hypothetical protein
MDNNVKTGMTVVLEDHGQDFLEFDLDERGEIIETRPYQGRVLNGRKVLNKNLGVGDRLLLAADAFAGKSLTIKYPVESIKSLTKDTAVPAIVFYPAGSLGEPLES